MTLPGSMGVGVTPELIRSLTDLAGIAVSTEEIEALIPIVTNQMAMAAQLRRLKIEDIPPITGFDPRWW